MMDSAAHHNDAPSQHNAVVNNDSDYQHPQAYEYGERDLLVDIDQPSTLASSQGSTDSANGFVKLDHPIDLLAEYGQQLTDHLLFDSEGTPSDEISPSSPDVMDEGHIVVPHGDTTMQQRDEHKDLLQQGDEGVAGELHDYLVDMKGAVCGTVTDIGSAIESTAGNVYGKIDDLMTHFGERSPDDHISPSGDSGRDTVGHLIGDSGNSSPRQVDYHLRDTSPDERTYERQGPLTVHEPVKAQIDTSIAQASAAFDTHQHPNSDQAQRVFDQYVYDDAESPKLTSTHGGFDTDPRPPTPPKEPSQSPTAKLDEPGVIDLGPPSHPPQKSDVATPYSFGIETKHTPRSILKSSSDPRGPWFDFKTVDRRG
jgi:hypothetical protein